MALQQYRHLLGQYLKPQLGRVMWLAIALLGSIGLEILNPQILGYFIDAVVSGQSQQTLISAALLFMGIAIIKQVLSVLASYFGETVAWTATNALRFDLVQHCLGLDLSFYQSRTPGELLERVDGDVNAISRFFSQLIIHVLGNGLLLFGILAVLFFENALAGFSLTLFSLLALSVLLSIRGFAVKPWAQYRQLSAEFFGFVGEHLDGREDIQPNGAVSYVMRRFYGILQRWLPTYQKARVAATLLWTSSVGLFTIGSAIALSVSLYLWRQDAITIGSAYLIFHYSNLLRQPIERIRQELEQLQQVEASIYRIHELFAVQSQLRTGRNLSLPQGALSVAMQNVYFRYEKDWTLNNINFQLPAGSVLGILGRTGSGKSTLAKLLLRFYDLQQGSIQLGDVAISDVPLKELRQRVGLVTQDVQLFQSSIRDNLTFFNPEISDDQILQTLHDLELSPWLNSLPQGLDTILSSDSGGLSAGQAQLLAFARIFLKNPDLVILDEASSRLDPKTEALIENAVDNLLANRTGIMIAHRLQTLERADQILILEQGKIIEYGDLATLVQDSTSHYRKLLQKSGLVTR